MNLKVADIFTLLSVAAALCAVKFAVGGLYMTAAWFLFAAAILDFLDGKVARMMGQASTFGMYLDSLADVVAFGAVPAVITIIMVGTQWYVILIVTIFVAAGIYRLARFQATKLKGEFQGMPITVNGILFAGLMLLDTDPWTLGYLLLASALMVSTLKVKKL
jgi:CDP-diacylglycerol---serine O-phosphatidyltransferase